MLLYLKRRFIIYLRKVGKKVQIVKRKFNITGLCVPQKHYMVDINERLAEIRKMVDEGDYFAINRARQYGKTTTLAALARVLADDYIVVSLDFQALGDFSFENENIFAVTFAEYFLSRMRRNQECIMEEKLCRELDSLEKEIIGNKKEISLFRLFSHLISICAKAPKPMVLIIDEADSASNNQVFLDFLAQLRNYYLERESIGTQTFQSVIIAGLYDIKNLKKKIRPDEEHQINSPWNIAAEFNIDMSFSVNGIAGMLADYESDYHTGMDIEVMSALLYDYTSGYPFLVSRLCKLMDEDIAGSEEFTDKSAAWTKEGFQKAVKVLLNERNTLFESLLNKLNDYPILKQVLYTLLFQGKGIAYNPDDDVIRMALMFGFVKVEENAVVVANRIFETRLYNYFLLTFEAQKSEMFLAGVQGKNQFIQNGHLNMELVLEKFVTHFDELYGDQTFYEEDGRRYFLLYLKPIINGTGNYYIESRTRNMERTDVIVDYQGEQFVIEMKVWRGDAYNTRGEQQLSDYLDYYHLKKGYMLSFNFNKKKQIGIQRIILEDKVLVEAIV